MGGMALYFWGVGSGAAVALLGCWCVKRAERRERIEGVEAYNRIRRENDRLQRQLRELSAQTQRERCLAEVQRAYDQGYEDGKLSPVSDAERFVNDFEQFGQARSIIKGRQGGNAV